MSAYEVTHLDELDRFRVDDEGLVWRPVRRRLGIQAFGTNAYTAANAGDRVVEEHSEAPGHEFGGHEELYFVARGAATFTLDGEEFAAPTGTFVFCPPGTRRVAYATEPETTVVVFGAKPGVPHRVSPWEEIFVAFGHLRNGDEELGRKHIEAAVAERPDDWQGHYNAACFDAQTGRREDAIRHLRRAVELDPRALEFARTDQDFDEIRDDPEFPR